MKEKTYPDEIKEQVLKGVAEAGNVALVARKHGIPSTTINTLNSKKRILLSLNHSDALNQAILTPIITPKKLKKKMISLKSCLVKKTLKLQFLKTF